MPTNDGYAWVLSLFSLTAAVRRPTKILLLLFLDTRRRTKASSGPRKKIGPNPSPPVCVVRCSEYALKRDMCHVFQQSSQLTKLSSGFTQRDTGLISASGGEDMEDSLPFLKANPQNNAKYPNCWHSRVPQDRARVDEYTVVSHRACNISLEAPRVSELISSF